MLRRILCPGSTVISIALLLSVVLIAGSRSQGVAMAGGISLRPPFAGTYRLTSFFDHYYPNYTADPDGRITIYTGENVANCSPHCYRGHSGYDWSMSTGTPILAAADGIVESRVESNVGYGNRIVIRHDNGYRTLYAHLREHRPDQGSPAFNVVVDQRVRAGEVIGWSGNTGGTDPHLHFGVYRGPCVLPDDRIYENNATDPFGWRGSQPDPLRNFPNAGQGHTASCLWRSYDEDPISCADTIVEDAGRGSTVAGAWLTSTLGSGYHMYYRRNTTDSTIRATWLATTTVGGIYKVYAYIPSQFATTRQATYQIWTTSGWQSRTIDQLSYSDVWVLLGTYRLPANYAYVMLSANTGEPANTTWVAADAIKFRSYLTSLPLVLKCWPALRPAAPVLNPINNPTHSPNYTVSWQPASGAETYTLQEATNPNFTGAVTVYTGAATSWRATNKRPGTYYYRVRATNCAGNSGWSDVRWTIVLRDTQPRPFQSPLPVPEIFHSPLPVPEPFQSPLPVPETFQPPLPAPEP